MEIEIKCKNHVKRIIVYDDFVVRDRYNKSYLIKLSEYGLNLFSLDGVLCAKQGEDDNNITVETI